MCHHYFTIQLEFWDLKILRPETLRVVATYIGKCSTSVITVWDKKKPQAILRVFILSINTLLNGHA